MAHIFSSDRTSTPAPTPRHPRSRSDHRLSTLQAQADSSAPTDRLTQLKSRLTDAPLQRMEDEELLQGKFKAEQPAQQSAAHSGLPPALRAGVEHLSGTDMSNVKVHYNSSAPAQMQAHAYAQGNNIHVAPGQEKHLPHEAWHVAQQQQGRVKPTSELGGVAVNDDPALEHEADTMGAKLQSR